MTPLGHIGLTPLHVFDVLVHVLYIYSGTVHAATLILLSSSPLQSLTNEKRCNKSWQTSKRLAR